MKLYYSIYDDGLFIVKRSSTIFRYQLITSDRFSFYIESTIWLKNKELFIDLGYL